jgi:hypothetical protein
MERNEINIPFHCLDILKKRGTKLMVSGDIILNSFHYIPLRSAPFHYISLIQTKPKKSAGTFDFKIIDLYDCKKEQCYI